MTILDTNNASGDAFGRLRFSSPVTVFDSKQISADPDILATAETQPIFYDNAEISGAGTSTLFDVDKAQTTISVANATAGLRVRQTKMRFNYQPGKSQLVLLSFRFTTALVAGVLRKIGQFDDDNGIFFDDDGTSYGIVLRSKASGAVVDTRVAQADWNLDKAPSLDFTKTQILVIDYEWLGVGRVRVGFNVDGVTRYVHEFRNANNLDVVYVSTPNLPVRCEIENTGAGPVAGLSQICASISSEGGTDETGVVRSASTNGTHVDANTENTIYAVLGTRLRAAYLNAIVSLVDASIQEQAGGKQIEWMLLLNPTVAGTFTYAGEAQSALEIARGATANTVTGGHRIAGGYFNSAGGGQGSGTVSTTLRSAVRLGATIAGVQDTIVLCVRPVGGSSNADIEASLTWRELS
jgi:hypothetical protein